MADLQAAQIISKLLIDNNGTIRTADVVAAGLSRTTLGQLVKDGVLERVAHGQYTRPDTFPDELHLIQRRAGKIVFSHETALYLHDMAERAPLKHAVTIPANSKLSPALGADLKIYYVKPEFHDIGKCTLPSKWGHDVVAYNAERTVCDILRSRSRIDTQTFAAALKNYTAGHGQNWKLLMEYAEVFRVTKLIHQYLEVLT